VLGQKSYSRLTLLYKQFVSRAIFTLILIVFKTNDLLKVRTWWWWWLWLWL